MSLSPDVIDAMVASGLTVGQLAAIVKADLIADERRREEEAQAKALIEAEEATAKLDRRARDAAKKRRQRAAKDSVVPACPPMSPDVPGDVAGQSGTSRGQSGTSPETKVSPTPPSKTQTPTPFSPLKGTVSPTPESHPADEAGEVRSGLALTAEPAAQLVAKPKLTDPPTPTEATEFEAWWQHYPNRVAKKSAVMAFVRVLRTGEATVETLVAGAEAYTASLAQTGYSAAHPATWLNGRRWDDEPPPPASLTTALRTHPGSRHDHPAARSTRNDRVGNMLAGLVDFVDGQQR